jgi:hypothetical protein
VAYRMVAERDDQKVIKERASALIVLANARVWESEGWQVMITDTEGKEFDPAGFEKLLGPGYAWSPQEPLALSPQYQAMALVPQTDLVPEAELAPEAEEASTEEAGHAADAASETEAETLEAENFDELESIEETGHDEQLEPLEEADEYDDFEPFDETEALEDELEPHH